MLIYTTNAFESFNRQLRKVIKAKSVFPTNDSLLKILHLAMTDHDGYYEKVDGTAAGLESDPCPDGDLFCRAYARITPQGTDPKDKMNGSAALDSQPLRRYDANKTVAGQTCCRQI